jgi:hypothetical protein
MKGRHISARRALCVCTNQPHIKDDPIKNEAIIPLGVFTLSRERKLNHRRCLRIAPRLRPLGELNTEREKRRYCESRRGVENLEKLVDGRRVDILSLRGEQEKLMQELLEEAGELLEVRTAELSGHRPSYPQWTAYPRWRF